MDLDRFVGEIKAYKARTGKAHKAIAAEFGIELGYFHKVLYRDKPLTLQVVEKAAPILGLTISDFILGSPSFQDRDESWDESFANIMGRLGPHIPEDVKKHLVALAQVHQPAPDDPGQTNVIDAIWHDLSPEGQAAMVAFGKSLRDHNHRQAPEEPKSEVKGKRAKKTG